MRVVIQRVKRAKVIVDSQVINEITAGLLLFVGISNEDTLADCRYMAKKIAHLRIFEDQQGKLNKSIIDEKKAILSISQFSVYGCAKNGNRPSFTKSAKKEEAKQLYEKFNELLIKDYQIATYSGVFGANMEIDLINDGPLTIIIDSPN